MRKVIISGVHDHFWSRKTCSYNTMIALYKTPGALDSGNSNNNNHNTLPEKGKHQEHPKKIIYFLWQIIPEVPMILVECN